MAVHGPLLSQQQTPSGIPKTESSHPPLSNHALRFGNGGLYLDSGEAPVNWHGTGIVAIPRRPIATAGIDQLQRGHRINCNATEVHSEQQMHRPWRLQLRHCTNCNSMDKLQLDANQLQSNPTQVQLETQLQSDPTQLQLETDQLQLRATNCNRDTRVIATATPY